MLVALAATAVCSVDVPALHALPQGGVETGHVVVTCSKPWTYSDNQIQYKDRWRILGREEHPGGAADETVTESIDTEPDYHGTGWWREVVIIHGASGWTFKVTGPQAWLEA